VQLGVCGDSVVASQVDRVHASGVDMARAVCQGLALRGAGSADSLVGRMVGRMVESSVDQFLEPQL